MLNIRIKRLKALQTSPFNIPFPQTENSQEVLYMGMHGVEKNMETPVIFGFRVWH